MGPTARRERRGRGAPIRYCISQRWDPLVANKVLGVLQRFTGIGTRYAEAPSFTTSPSGFRLRAKTGREGVGQSQNSDNRNQQATAATSNRRIQPF
jgi:hypothetical protein